MKAILIALCFMTASVAQAADTVLDVEFSTWLPAAYQILPSGQGGTVEWYWMPWGLAMHWSVPFEPCQAPTTPGWCDPQTNRATIIELGVPGVVALAERHVRATWILYSDRPVDVVPIIWQELDFPRSYRIFSCPPERIDVTAWRTIECTILLPSVEGLVIGPRNGVGAGLDLAVPYDGWLDLAHMTLVTLP